LSTKQLRELVFRVFSSTLQLAQGKANAGNA